MTAADQIGSIRILEYLNGTGMDIDDIRVQTVSPVPAPPSLLLLLTGMGCLGGARWFRKRK